MIELQDGYQGQGARVMGYTLYKGIKILVRSLIATITARMAVLLILITVVQNIFNEPAKSTPFRTYNLDCLTYNQRVDERLQKRS
jgi:uncharacterized protein HemY